MAKHSSFPKIGQYREVVREVQMMCAYVGKDKNGDAVYDHTLPKPIIRFKGTIKLHGTNAGVGHTPEDGIWAQSRENIIEIGNDNAGFAFFVNSKLDVFNEMVEHVREVNYGKINANDGVIIFGEWAGAGIQKGVAIIGIPKSFFIFDVKIVPADGSPSYYIEHDYLRSPENKIYNIDDYLSYEIDIDFNSPERVQNQLAEITQTVEDLCPVGKAFGLEGVGEGVVWSAVYNNSKLRFKVKGLKHSASKVKVLASVDTEKLATIDDFVNYAVTESRINQGIGIIFPDGQLDKRKLGDFLKWMMSDIIAEESDTLADNGLEPKDVGKYVSNKAKNEFLLRYNDLNS